jgi:transglutaminase-like putative cysteine protease
MRISVLHSTIYRFGAPVWVEPHTFRLRPRDDGSQRLEQYALDISPTPAGQSWCLDQDGNVVLEAWFHDPVERLSVMSSFQVETLRENPFDFLAARAGLDERMRVALAPYSAAVSGPVAEFARSIGGDGLDFLAELNRRLYEEFAHTVREEGAAEAPDTTLAVRSGSCRDLPVLFCDACRSRGIPARFVSGYEREASIQAPAHMHAWAEVYVPGGGWRGYDPSQGLAVSTSHVALAAAAQAAMAAPVSGSYRGAAGARMEYSISMQVGS